MYLFGIIFTVNSKKFLEITVQNSALELETKTIFIDIVILNAHIRHFHFEHTKTVILNNKKGTFTSQFDKSICCFIVPNN